jgi:hypothetical protein
MWRLLSEPPPELADCWSMILTLSTSMADPRRWRAVSASARVSYNAVTVRDISYSPLGFPARSGEGFAGPLRAGFFASGSTSGSAPMSSLNPKACLPFRPDGRFSTSGLPPAPIELAVPFRGTARARSRFSPAVTGSA